MLFILLCQANVACEEAYYTPLRGYFKQSPRGCFKMLKKIFAPWLYSRELEAVISDINTARRELSVALEIARTNEAVWACDAKILRDEAVKKNAELARLHEAKY